MATCPWSPSRLHASVSLGRERQWGRRCSSNGLCQRINYGGAWSGQLLVRAVCGTRDGRGGQSAGAVCSHSELASQKWCVQKLIYIASFSIVFFASASLWVLRRKASISSFPEEPATAIIKATSALLNYSPRKRVGKEHNRRGLGVLAFSVLKSFLSFVFFYSFTEGELQILLGCALLFSSVYLQDW